MFDYGISLRCDSGKMVLRKLLPVLKLLMLLKEGADSTEYIRCIIMQLNLLKYDQCQDNVKWKMFVNQFSVFNEEAGEISFSILARTVSGHSNKTDLEHMNTMYQQINRVRQIDDDFEAEGGAIFKSGKHWHKKYNEDSEMVVTIGQFVKARVREIVTGRFTQYDGDKAGYTNKEAAQAHQIPFDKTSTFWRADIGADWDAHSEKVKQWVHSNFGSQVVSVWPEVQPQAVVDMPAFHADSRLDERMHRRRRYVPSPCSPVSGMEDASPELGSFESEEEFSFCSADREFDSDEERGWRSDDPRRELPDDVLSDEDQAGGKEEVEEEEEEPDPRQTQSWKNWGSVDPALIVPGGRARKRTKPSSEFMVEDFKE